jgi:hypothetical protein
MTSPPNEQIVECTAGDHSVRRPDSVSFIVETDESFVQSNAATPIDELASRLLPTDPMTASFVDGTPNTRNPFLDKSSCDDTSDMHIVQHTTAYSSKHAMPSIDEIHPQGLPMNDEHQSTSTKSNTKKFVGVTQR